MLTTTTPAEGAGEPTPEARTEIGEVAATTRDTETAESTAETPSETRPRPGRSQRDYDYFADMRDALAALRAAKAITTDTPEEFHS